MNTHQTNTFYVLSLFIAFVVSLGAGFMDTATGAENMEELVIHKGVDHLEPGKAAGEKGFLIIPGTVENRTGSWVYIIVHIKLYDRQGQELTAGSTAGKNDQAAPTLNVRVAPGASGIFEYIRELAKIAGEYDHCELAAEWIATDGGAVGEITEVDTTSAPPYLKVTGVFKNIGANACKFPEAVVAGYDAAGKIYKAGASGVNDALGNPIETLQPGKLGTFELLLPSADSNVKNVKVLAGCGY